MRARNLTSLLIAVPLLLAQQPTHGIVVADMDRSTRPGDDFFAYANGTWLQHAEIPADRAATGVNVVLADRARQQTSDLISEAAKSNAPAGSGPRKIADFYASYLDETRIDSLGLSPLKPHIDAIAAIRTKKDLARALGESMRADVDALNNTNFHTSNLFGLWVAPGFADVEHYAAYLMQGGLALPDREYYLADNPRMQSIRTSYTQHAAAMLKLAGLTDPDARAGRIVALERAIAEKHLSLAECEDVHKANNTWKRTDFAAKAPGLDWPAFFLGAGLDRTASFTVWQPSAFIGESALVASQSLETWKDWLTFHLLETYAEVLPQAFRDEHFSFSGKVLAGIPVESPRWQRAVNQVNARLGDEVGRIYSQRYFSPESKAAVQAMVTNIIAAFRKRIDALDWMAPATKAEAQAKLSTLYVGVGYPEKWHDYAGYDVRADDAFGNLWRGLQFRYAGEKQRLGRPIDRQEWSMTPQTVNAVNLPLQNALNFPAAFLQAPHFDPLAPAAVNYGQIGSVIGHEISHTFDTEGAAFDSKGRVRNWWTPSDFDHFSTETAKLAAQYSAYKPFPDLSLNGQQTLAENIADVAGLAAAWDAYRTSLNGKAAPQQDGFTGDQQFFIANAQGYQQKIREASLRRQIATDPHAPSRYRTATVRNLDAWYSAFQVKPEDQLYLAPGDRSPVW